MKPYRNWVKTFDFAVFRAMNSSRLTTQLLFLATQVLNVYLLARCLLRILRSPVDGTFVHYPQGAREETMLAGLDAAMDVLRRKK